MKLDVRLLQTLLHFFLLHFICWLAKHHLQAITSIEACFKYFKILNIETGMQIV